MAEKPVVFEIKLLCERAGLMLPADQVPHKADQKMEISGSSLSINWQINLLLISMI